MTREDEEEEEDNVKTYTPEQIKEIALRILGTFKQESSNHSLKEFKAFVSKSKATYWISNYKCKIC